MPDPARKYSQITKAVYERPWAIQPAMLVVIEEIVRLRAVGSPLTDQEIDQRVEAASNGPRRGGLNAQGVAVIPIYGVISQRMNLLSAMSGGTSVESITRDFRQALADPEVGAIVFDVDSPGGSVDGIEELAAEIRAARGRKPMASVSNSLMASAAYYLGSAADEVIAAPSSQVGSIGVVAMHPDQSKADEMEGVTYNVITAGGQKDVFNPHVPLSEEGRSELQAIADDFYGLFANAVATSRGVPVKTVTDDWQARVFTAQKAKAAGLVDRVDTLDATVRRMMITANQGSPSALAALGELDAPQAIAGLLASLPIHEQLALLNAEAGRVAVHYAKRAELRAKEGRDVPEATTEQLAALASLGTIQGDLVDPDLDTDQPEEAVPSQAVTAVALPFEILEAATRGSYQLPPREVPVS